MSYNKAKKSTRRTMISGKIEREVPTSFFTLPGGSCLFPSSRARSLFFNYCKLPPISHGLINLR